MKVLRKLSLSVLPVALFCFSGCFVNYYSTGTTHGLGDTTISVLQDKGKYVIAHFKREKVMALKNIVLKDSLIEADMEQVSADHLWYLHPTPDSALSYKKKHKEMLNEVHLYALNQNPGNVAHLTLADTSVSRWIFTIKMMALLLSATLWVM